jgi:hypothetical protein
LELSTKYRSAALGHASTKPLSKRISDLVGSSSDGMVGYSYIEFPRDPEVGLQEVDIFAQFPYTTVEVTLEPKNLAWRKLTVYVHHAGVPVYRRSEKNLGGRLGRQ